MSWNLIARVTTVACCLGFGLFVVANDEATKDPTLRELQSMKLDLLEDIAERYRFGFSLGKPVLEELLAAEHQVLLAKLDLTDSQTDRIKLREEVVKNRSDLVDARIAGMRLGKNAEVDMLTARVMLIDAQIDLANARSQGGHTR